MLKTNLIYISKKIVKFKFKKLICLNFIFCGFSINNIFAVSTNNEIDQQSFKSRFSLEEPNFSNSRTGSQWIGLYFGVGFRKVRLNVLENIMLDDSDGEANGIGVNLGYLWDEQGLEFERQTIILNHENPLSYENEESRLLELIQNNFWYIRYKKISRFFYFQYGTGVQFTKIRLAGTQSKKLYKDEIAIGIETGISYYITSNILLLYRFSLGQQIPFISKEPQKKFLNQSQIQTLYLNYYFDL